MSPSPQSGQKAKNPQASSVQNVLRVLVYGHRHLTVVTEIYSVRALCTLGVTFECS